MKKTKKYIAYYRVSTTRQGQSGLGLEGQEASVNAFTDNVVASYTEVETGTGKKHRPELAKAIAHCRRSGAVLIIAKLDRLARNVYFVSGLMESGVEFLACDNPTANRLTIHILAAVAEDEARRISERTKAALDAYRARGGVLGASREECRNLTTDDRKKGSQANSRNADAVRQQIRPIAEKMRQAGTTLAAIAAHLNEEGFLTRRGKGWSAVGVHRVLGC